MAQELGLGYDLFDSVMNAREKQAENMAIEILKYGNKVQFSSDSYKPGVDYVDGSYSLLVQHYIKEHGGYVVKENPMIYVLVHEGDKVPDNVPVFDPWRTYKGTNVVYYGNTRKNKGIICE
jgi:hypothetical protein